MLKTLHLAEPFPLDWSLRLFDSIKCDVVPVKQTMQYHTLTTLIIFSGQNNCIDKGLAKVSN